MYYPGASIFTTPEQGEGATVEFNFGPNFRHEPPKDEGMACANPMCKMTFTVGVAPKVEPEPVKNSEPTRNITLDNPSPAEPKFDPANGDVKAEETGTAQCGS